MANNFKRYTSRNIGTSATQVGAYTVASNTQATIIGLSLCNVSSSAVSVTAYLRDNSTNNTYIIKDANIPAGGSLILAGGDQKIVMETGDSIRVVSSASSSIDVILSVLEIFN